MAVRARRNSIVVPNVVAAQLPGDNASAEVVRKRRARLQRVLDEFKESHAVAVEIRDWSNDALHIDFVLSPNVLEKQREFEALAKSRLGRNWSMRAHVHNAPAYPYRTRFVAVDTLAVRVEAGLAKTPLRTFLCKALPLAALLFVLCYFLSVTPLPGAA
jgi:hypothetical protein